MGKPVEMTSLRESTGCRPHVYTYTVLASRPHVYAYSNGEDMEEAHKIFVEAKKKHVKLGHLMFHALIHGYCKLSLGARLWCRPSVDEYDKLIQSLCLKALDWEMAEKLHEEMKGSGLRLKCMMRGLIRAVKEMDKEVVEALEHCRSGVNIGSSEANIVYATAVILSTSTTSFFMSLTTLIKPLAMPLRCKPLPFISSYEEETTVLIVNYVNVSNNIEIQESLSGHSDNEESDTFISEKSFQGTKSLLEVNFPDTNSHSELIKDDGLEKEIESHEKLCADKSDGKDGNEFGSSVIDTCGTPPSIDNTNDNSLTKVNCTTEDSLTSLLDSSIVDNPLKFDHEENYKSGMVYTCDMAIGSNGDTNGERKMLPDSNACKLATSDQVEEPKVTENGVPFSVDAYVNNSNKASEESGAVSDQKHFVVLEAKRVSFIAGLTVVDSRHKEEESYKNKIENIINNGTINANDTSGREKRAYLDNADRARIINVAEEEEDPMGSTQRTGSANVRVLLGSLHQDGSTGLLKLPAIALTFYCPTEWASLLLF
ncbi:hypothetical protein JHK82_018817 [Glycine max]|nr:hypothetical protein JHK85_019261 [Glycine max]KAG5143122.1 hypothetical protein JHK82_018817 [Glycine max]